MTGIASVFTAVKQVFHTLKTPAKDRSYTVMVVPDETTGVIRCQVSKAVMRCVFAGAIAFVVVCLVLFADYLGIRGKAAEVERLRRETRQQKQELTAFAKSMGELQDQMDRLRQFDTKLRVMTDLNRVRYQDEFASEADQGVARGGANPELLNPLRQELSSQDEALIRNLGQGISQLRTETEVQERSFQELIESLEDQKSLLASTPSVWPVKGWLTSGFGNRVSPFTGTRELHRGLDIATRSGTSIMAPADGVVVYLAREGGYGLTVVVDHGYGIKTQYGHLQETSVGVGKRVKRGDVIARVGNSGRSTGPHLHYEVLVNGASVNPMRYILN